MVPQMGYPDGTPANGWYYAQDYRCLIHYKDGYWDSPEDLPALVRLESHRTWYRKGLIHREEGPADISHDGFQAWYLNGKKVCMETVLDTPEKREAYLLEESLRRL